MLNKRLSNFAELVWGAASRLGRDPARVTDDIIGRAFPKTIEEAKIEGADKMLRTGALSAVKSILSRQNDEGQMDFSDIAPSFRSIAERLKKKAYYVEALGEYIPVVDLIKSPHFLDDARKLMRRKGDECLSEALVLDELYAAVTRMSAA